DVEYVNVFALLRDAVDHAIDVRLVAIEQMPEFGGLRCFRTAVRLFFETQNCLPEAPVPLDGSIGVFCINRIEDEHKAAPRAERDINEVGHAALQIPRRTPSPDGPCPPSRLPGPVGYLRPRRPGRRYPAAADRLRHPARWLRPS